MSAAPSGRFTTRSEIEDYDTSDFADAAARWRTAADQSDEVFDRHRQNIASPGGTTWEGDAKDAALERATADGVVAGDQNRVVRESADIAENAATDINAAQHEVVGAITTAENDGFKVAEDLKVADARRYDINTVVARNKAAKEHAEDIQWYAERLGQTVAFAEGRLQKKAGELEGIRFEGEGEGESRDGEPTVRLVDNKVVQDKPDEERKDEPSDKPTEQATGQIGPFAVPKTVEDAAKKNGLKPDEKTPSPTPDDGGLGDLLGANDHAEHKPGDEKNPGLPPALSQLPPAPDKAAIDRQAAKVESARQALAAAEAKQKAAAVHGVVQGAGSGPSPDEFKSLTQAVFDARHELTEQTDALRDLSAASVANGGPVVPVPALPLDADKQAFPPPSSISDTLADANHQLSENTFGLIPDVAKDIDTLNNWGTASTEGKAQAVLDSAGMLPLPFGKPLAEGLEHGLDGLGAVTRHSDEVHLPHVDAPSPHADAPPAGHAPVDTPVEHHTPTDAPVEHHISGGAADDLPAVAEHAPHPVGDALTNAGEAVIDPRKFDGYSMDPSNVNNGGKWQAWQQIGYDVGTDAGRQSAASDVVAQIQSQLGSTPAEALPATKWGERFQVNMPISGPSGDGTLVTVWQVENGVPRMITNFLKVWK